MKGRVLALVFALAATAGAYAQQPAGDAAVAVSGDVTTPFTLHAAELHSMPRAKVTINEDGQDVVYEGVPVSEVLKKAGVPLGRDATVSSYVVARAKDG